EVHALLALMLLNDARREARFENGELVLLSDQDRALWDADKIGRGRDLLDRAIALGGGGSYVRHAGNRLPAPVERPPWAALAPQDCPWLGAPDAGPARRPGSPVGELTRAIAVAEAEGPEAGLALADPLDLDGYRYFHPTRADLLRRLGRNDEARTAFERALEL